MGYVQAAILRDPAMSQRHSGIVNCAIKFYKESPEKAENDQALDEFKVGFPQLTFNPYLPSLSC